MSKYETLLFDFGGTLDADGIPWMERFHEHYCAEGLTMSVEAFAPFFYPADDQLVGTISREADLSATVAELIANLEAGLDCEKADPGIFRAALEPLGAVPERTLFIGDSLRRDREGARRLGMDFIWIAPAEAQQAETRSGTAPLGHPAVTR